MRVLVHIHIFYAEYIKELAVCARNLECACGQGNVVTWVTFPAVRGEELESACREAFPSANIMEMPNAGYDVGPFFETLAHIDLSRFDVVVKIHTKRDSPPMWINFRNLEGAKWRQALLSFCATRKAAERMVRLFEHRQDVGMIAGRGVIDINGFAVDHDRERLREALVQIGADCAAPMRVWGTMFAVRTAILQRIGPHRITEFLVITDENAHKVYGAADYFEELIPVVTQALGYRISSATYPLCIEQAYFVLARPVFSVFRTIARLARRIFRK